MRSVVSDRSARSGLGCVPNEIPGLGSEAHPDPVYYALAFLAGVGLGLVLWIGASEVFSMWRYTLIIAALITLSSNGRCDTVQFTVSPADIGLHTTSPVVLFSSGLDGIVLAGQILSLDLVLNDNALARLTNNTGLGIDLVVFTDAPSFPGFSGPGGGFLLDPNGNQLGQKESWSSSGDASDGSFFVGLVPVSIGGAIPQGILDISGVHFDITFPSTGYIVTNAELIFAFNPPYDSVEFGTARQLPEPPTVIMILIGVACLVFRDLWRRNKQRTPLPTY